MSARSTDEQHLNHALDLARQSIGLASPNPYVGAVIVDLHENVVGIGRHTYDGIKHAEILALEAAREKARGGTLYINLEPCSHQGRTPPCADALIAAGIRRVAASIADPNPQVSGRGFEKLRSAGIQVEVGGLADEARRLNESFARYIRTGRPFVMLKSAMTLDGKIAPCPSPRNQSASATANYGFTGSWITSEKARAHVQELRHQHDAILAGIGTVLADNPLLTDRSGLPRRRPLLRVILDSRLRLPLESRLVLDARIARHDDVLVFCSSVGFPDSDHKKSQLEQLGIRVEKVAAGSGDRLDLTAILKRLADLHITSVLIEGGSTVNGNALADGIVDKILFYYAPTILGADSVPFASGKDFTSMADAVQVKSLRLHRFGEDFAVEGYLRDPYEE